MCYLYNCARIQIKQSSTRSNKKNFLEFSQYNYKEKIETLWDEINTLENKEMPKSETV